MNQIGIKYELCIKLKLSSSMAKSLLAVANGIGVNSMNSMSSHRMDTNVPRHE